MSNSTKAIAAIISVTSLFTFSGQAQEFSDQKLKIGVLDDLDGPYSGLGGRGTVTAAEMAVEDFVGDLGSEIELVSATHGLSPDIGAGIAQRWFDVEQVDAIVGFCASNVAAAIQAVGADKQRVTLNACATSTVMTGENCSPYGVSWLYDSYAIAQVATRGEIGEQRWFFITADYNFGRDLQNEVTAVLDDRGGQVVGSVNHPFPALDMSSFLLQAQSAQSDVIAIANAGQDTTTTVVQAAEFGLLGGSSQFIILAAFENDLENVNLDGVAGAFVTSPFVWSRTEETRAWADRFLDRAGMRPNAIHAAVYSSVTHYLNSVLAAKTDDAELVMAKMRELPVSDFYAEGGYVRSDGRLVHDLYLAEVKDSESSTEERDIFQVIEVIPAEDTVSSLIEISCPYVNK